MVVVELVPVAVAVAAVGGSSGGSCGSCPIVTMLSWNKRRRQWRLEKFEEKCDLLAIETSTYDAQIRFPVGLQLCDHARACSSHLRSLGSEEDLLLHGCG